MNGKIPKRIVIEEDTGCYGPITYYTKLIIKKNSISYQEATEGDIMFYPDRKHSYKYIVASSLFEAKFNELVDEITKVDEELKNGTRWKMNCYDAGINKITIYYDNRTKLELYFYHSLFNNNYDNIANIIRSMIPSCEKISGYLMTDDERASSLFCKLRV